MSTKCFHNNKTCFGTQKLAEMFITKLKAINNGNNYLRVYKCEFCNCYHLTSKDGIMPQKKTHLKHYNKFKKYMK